MVEKSRQEEGSRERERGEERKWEKEMDKEKEILMLTFEETQLQSDLSAAGD